MSHEPAKHAKSKHAHDKHKDAPVPKAPAPWAPWPREFVIHRETGLMGFVETVEEGGRTFNLVPLAYVTKNAITRVGDPAPSTVHTVANFEPFNPNDHA